MRAHQIDATEGVNWLGLAGFAALLVGFGVLFLVAVVLPARREARALDALSRRRGWSVRRNFGSGGTGTRIHVAPVAGGDWQAEVSRYQNGNVQIRVTEYRAAAPRLTQGVVVIGPGLDDGEAALAERLLGGMEGASGQALLRGLTDGRLAPYLAGLRRVPGVEVPRATVLGSGLAEEPAEAARLASRFAPLLAAWQAATPGDEAFPILIVSPEGSRLRLRRDANAAQLEALIDMGRALADEGSA